ncbi:MAG: flippase-like domain-containing protein [Acidimicrobiaceae bacterium]|nr:lysylphosphatidylglycerol synthase transmembrane domain-containing protein [Acidimicrobiaceae bacterium]MXY10212.1 flippase-like domain-containing protein [Acidimicrobiaceae bacterium]MXZ64147.1 flippase-like domain-containing protein [Acidimicrobiaceae bacterium]MYE64435.1 flippase-like domain-containing protein [Acidimicrobiaceae bacterium]MYF31789.1 flippase-like domain-containing protein [Acidimicrobiaceae bacterium]
MSEHLPPSDEAGPDPRAASQPEPMSPAAADRLEALRAPRPAQVALAAGVALIVTAVLVVSIGRFAGFTKLGDTLNGAAWGWLGLCALGQIGVFVGYAGAFRASLAESVSAQNIDPENSQVGVWYSLKVALGGFGLTQLVAAGGAAGMAFTFWVLRRLGFSKRNAMVQLITLNTAVYLVFGVLGWLGALVGLLDPAVPKAMTLSWLAGFIAVIAVARWFTQPHRAVSFGAADGAGRLRRALAVGVTAAARVRTCTRTADGRRLLNWSLLYWVGDLVSLWAALRAFGVTVSVAAIVVAYVMGYLAQSVPIPLIATGGVDAATTFTLRAVGVPIEVALLGVVAHRVFAFWLPVFPGLWSATVLVREEIPASGRRGRLFPWGRSA